MKKSLVIVGVLLAVVCSAQQVPKGLTASNGEFIGFYEYKPVDYNTGTKYPVIIFLHGIGERGNGTSELSRVLGNGTPQLIRDGHNMRFFWNGKWETFLVLTPQLASKYGNWENFYVDEMIKYAENNLSIDRNRIFLTGLSLGGGGVWKFAAGSETNARRLAGIGVTCGTCEPRDYGNIARANLPTWAWHANDDGTVGAGCSNSAISGILAANPAVKPYLTLWPTGNHWIWSRVYDINYWAQHPNIYEWFLGQNKSLAPNKRPVANAGADQNISSLSGGFTLNGNGSRDEDGNIVQYIWTKVSGPSSGSITAEVSVGSSTTVIGLNMPGTYVYELRVIDNRSDWTTDQVTINVSSILNPSPIGNQNPVARAGSDATITLPTNSATLNGDWSSDADGTLTSFTWSKVAGPSQFTLSNSTSSRASVTNLAQGTYTFRLTVKDNNNGINSDDVNITVNASSSTPTPEPAKWANAGQDISITLPTNSTTLNGSASADVSTGKPLLEYQWKKISGPSQYSITSPKAVITALTNLAEGTYAFELMTWRYNWEPRADTVVVTVAKGSGSGGGSTPTGDPNRWANAGQDITITLPTNSTSLNGSASADISTGKPLLEYQWKKISGPSQYSITSPKAVITSLTNLTEGTYAFELMTWRYNWEPRADTVVVVVKGSATGGGSGPTGDPNRWANAGQDISITLPTNSTSLNGSASADISTGKPLLEYQWKKISGPSQYTITNPKAVVTTLTNLAQGTYAFELMTWRYNWEPRADTVVVTVNGSGSGGGSGPTGDPNRWANAGQDILITLPTNSTILNGSASADVSTGKPLLEYQWKKISGPSQLSITSPKSAVTTLTNLTEGIYAFELMTWRYNWEPRADTVVVVVKGSGSGSGPINDPNRWANAGQDIFLTLPINSTTLNGSASADVSTGKPLLEYKWRKISGPAQYSITNPKAVTTTLTNLTQGSYAFELMTWRYNWEPRADTVYVLVMSGTAASGAVAATAEPVMKSAAKAPAAETTIDKLTVYPNPAHGMINVQMVAGESGKTVINVYDVTGRNVQTVNFEKTQSLQQRSLNVTRLAPGVYHLEVIINNKKKMITKFIKQ